MCVSLRAYMQPAIGRIERALRVFEVEEGEEKLVDTKINAS